MKRDIEVLRKKIAAMSATTAVKKDSDGYFQPFTDKGNGSAVLRFLPAEFAHLNWPTSIV